MVHQRIKVETLLDEIEKIKNGPLIFNDGFLKKKA